jgi:hypothetical protein
MHSPLSFLNSLRRCGPLHRPYRMNSSANATRHKQPGQKSHPLALPRKRAPSVPTPCYTDVSLGQEVDVTRRKRPRFSRTLMHDMRVIFVKILAG